MNRRIPNLTKRARRISVLPLGASVLWRCDEEARKIALTFDDGPDPEGTPAILDLLERRNVPATFFLLSERAANSPELVHAIRDSGHDIGLHSDVHEPLDQIPRRTLVDRLQTAKKVLEDIAERPITDHRPPHGRLAWRSSAAARRAGLRVVMWSHDALDWEQSTVDELAHRIASCFYPGALVLLHDGADTFPGQGPNTARALELVLHLVEARDLHPVTTGEQ